MRPARRLLPAAAAVLVVLVAVASGWLAFGSAQDASGASATAPTVGLDMPTTTSESCTCLRGVVTLSATATPSSGRSITSVRFESSPASQNSWTTITTRTDPPYETGFDTATLAPGVYDFRAVATDSAGETESAVARDRALANGITAVNLSDPGSVIRRTVDLVAAPEDGGAFPTSVTFRRAPADSENWTTIATIPPDVDSDGNPTGTFTAPFDTTSLSDGPYDFEVTATNTDTGDQFVSAPLRGRLVDNTAPTSALNQTGGPLQGVVTLAASAHDSGSGVSSVRFERALAGSGNWRTIGIDTDPPFERSFDSRSVPNGRYDFRTVVIDGGGNVGRSPVWGSVEIANPQRTGYTDFAITNFVVPASKVTLLGEVADSPQHETWALGRTDSPASSVDGQPLPFTSPGDGQIVLLRYRDTGGWQIADVLRNGDGSAFEQRNANVQVVGQMASSGEAWIALTQRSGSSTEAAVFHRLPGGRFLMDSAATDAMRPMLSSSSGLQGAEMRLGRTSGGQTFGVLRVPQQPPRPTQVTSAGIGSCRMRSRHAVARTTSPMLLVR